MKYTASVATNRVDLTGEMFSDECLEQMYRNAKGVPIIWNFNPKQEVGRVEHAVLEDGFLYVTFDADIDVEGLYAVPGFRKGKGHAEDNVYVYDDLQVMAYGLTNKPTDEHLTPLTAKYED